MEQFLMDNSNTIGTFIGAFVGITGLILTILERKLIVSRKHVTGVNGFTAVMVGSCLTFASVYMTTGRIIPAACVFALFIIAYALICHFIEKKEYPPEERYTKE